MGEEKTIQRKSLYLELCERFLYKLWIFALLGYIHQPRQHSIAYNMMCVYEAHVYIHLRMKTAAIATNILLLCNTYCVCVRGYRLLQRASTRLQRLGGPI